MKNVELDEFGQFVRELNREISREINHVNSGGCAYFAFVAKTALECVGIKTEVVVSSASKMRYYGITSASHVALCYNGLYFDGTCIGENVFDMYEEPTHLKRYGVLFACPVRVFYDTITDQNIYDIRHIHRQTWNEMFNVRSCYRMIRIVTRVVRKYFSSDQYLYDNVCKKIKQMHSRINKSNRHNHFYYEILT